MQLELQFHRSDYEIGESWRDVTVPAQRAPRRRLPVVPLPASRADCRGDGICPKFSCRYNLTLEVTKAGGIRLTASNDRRGGQHTWPLTPDARYPLWGQDSEEAFVERIATWLETVETNCALDIAEASDGLTLDEVADQLGLTKPAAAVVELRALRKLARHPDGAKLIEMFRARMAEAHARESTDFGE